ncbi:MAG: radical SAM protein [Acidobacteriaceae bacterium]
MIMATADVLLTHSFNMQHDRKQSRKVQPYPPLATLYAAATLRAYGISTAVFDSMLQDPYLYFQDALDNCRPRLVAVYEDDFNFLSKMCLTRMREISFYIAKAAARTGAIVVAHGSDATDHAEQYLQNGFHYVLVGEAEQSLREISGRLLAAEPCDDVAGLAFLRQGTAGPQYTIARKRSGMDELPSPALDLIDIAGYRRNWREAHGYFSLNLIASRGCPYRCNWCAKPVFGNSFSLRSPARVAEEMHELTSRYGAEHLWFADDVFALNRRWTEDFAQAVEDRGCVVPFKVQSRADLMHEQTVSALRRAGCNEVWMGVESGSQKVLDAMDKGLRVETVMRATERLRNAGIKACFFLQFGYPGEDLADIMQTIELVRICRPDDIGISITYPLPHTRLYERVRHQLGAKRNWSDSEDLCTIFQTAYTGDFYRAIRDALHREADLWRSGSAAHMTQDLQQLWQRVAELEPISRNADPTVLVNDDDGALIWPDEKVVVS